MESKELRIGNLVLMNDGEYNFRFTILTEEKIKQIQIGDEKLKYNNEAILSFWQPIRITHQLLGQCGFKMIDLNWYQDDNRILNIFYYPDKIVVRFIGDEKEYFCNTMSMFQNLYFEKTGQELELEMFLYVTNPEKYKTKVEKIEKNFRL